MAPSIGPFFYIRGKLVYNACPLAGGREQAGRLDNSYGHDRLYDDYFKTGEYIYYPRGRVVWDKQKSRSIIYIDPCINCENVLSKIIEDYVVEYDDHYHCKNCIGDLFNIAKQSRKMRFCFAMYQIWCEVTGIIKSQK